MSVLLDRCTNPEVNHNVSAVIQVLSGAANASRIKHVSRGALHLVRHMVPHEGHRKMRDINEVLREKEAEFARINREIEALRMVALLLDEHSSAERVPPNIGPQRATVEPQPVRKRWP